MPRIRTVKPEFWTSEKLASRLPGADGRQARLLFIGLWNLAEDKTGVARGSPAFLRGALFVYDEDVTARDVERWLSLLEAGGFIVRYQRDGSSYLWVRGFLDHQKIEKPSKPTLPEPTEAEKMGGGEPSPSPPRALPEPSVPEVVSSTGKERKGEEPSAAADAPPGGQASLVVVPAATPPPLPAKPKPPRKEAEGEHHALWRALEAEYARVMGHPYASGNGGQDAAAVKWLREGAKATPEESVRRWGNLLAWSKGGFPAVTGFASLRQHWNHAEVVGVAQDRRATTGPPSNPGRGASEAPTACAGCGTETGEGRKVGQPPVWIGHYCGCGTALANEVLGVDGTPRRDVAEWAKARREGRAA